MPTQTRSFQPDRFRSTVAYYVAHRPRYPDALLRKVLRELRLAHGARVLDLGCGPGFLAIALARLGCTAVGIDPNTEMLAAAEAEAAAAGVVGVSFRQGSSYDLGAAPASCDLVTMGRSFHWMDRADTLSRLDKLLAPGGGIALFHDHHIRCAQNAFDKVLDEVREAFGGPTELDAERKAGTWDPHEVVLMASPFHRLTRIGVIERRPLDTEAIVGRALSLSNTSPEKLGDRMETFVAELRRRLAELSPEGRFTELIELSALVAVRE